MMNGLRGNDRGTGSGGRVRRGGACPCCELRVKTEGAQEGKKKSSVKLLLAAAGPRATHAVKSRTRLGVKQPRT